MIGTHPVTWEDVGAISTAFAAVRIAAALVRARLARVDVSRDDWIPDVGDRVRHVHGGGHGRVAGVRKTLRGEWWADVDLDSLGTCSTFLATLRPCPWWRRDWVREVGYARWARRLYRRARS